MSIHVTIAKNLASAKPFPLVLTSSALVTVAVTLEVDDTGVEFGLIVEDVERAPATSHDVPVDGRADCQVVRWGAAPVGATVTATATDTASDETGEDAGVVQVGGAST